LPDICYNNVEQMQANMEHQAIFGLLIYGYLKATIFQFSL